MFRLLLVLVLLSGNVARAGSVPHVVADIAPVHALVARVMAGVGAPDLLVPPGSSPHHFSLRPSAAAGLERADLLIWIGPDLSPWLEGPAANLAVDSAKIALLEHSETARLPFREGEMFEASAHEEDAHEHDAHADDAHADDEDGHGHDEGAHDHGDGDDPHAWLDPSNGIAWLGLIAAELSRIDPENGEHYRANARAGQAEIEAVVAKLARQIEISPPGAFLVYHDAFQYFERAFGLSAQGALMDGDATPPGPRRLARLRDFVQDREIACLLAEPDHAPDLADTILQGTNAQVVILDPLGLDLEPGAELYPELLARMGAQLARCAG